MKKWINKFMKFMRGILRRNMRRRMGERMEGGVVMLLLLSFRRI
jgi:hypothetical protein